MTMRLPACAVAIAVLLQGCGGGSPSNRDNSLSRGSSGVALTTYETSLTALDGLAYFAASEADQNATDLNGDGDFGDNVVHSLDPMTGTVVNLGVSLVSIPKSGTTRVAWFASELNEGVFDANGDGDVSDWVLVVYDPATPVSPLNPAVTNVIGTTNFGSLEVEGDRAIVLTFEADANADLNGDGDTVDQVIRIVDLVSLTVFNTNLAFDGAAGTLVTGSGLAVLGVSESGSGMQDLNGDGDSSDTVLVAVELATNTLINVGPGGFAAAYLGQPLVGGTPAAPSVTYAISESDDGGVNLNAGLGDADMTDGIVAVFDVPTRTEFLPFGGIACDPEQLALGETRSAFLASEADNGMFSDFNGDGDFEDLVPFWVDLTQPTLANPVAFAAEPSGGAFLRVCGEALVFIASESRQGPNGTNLNGFLGDTDTSDKVALYLDLSAPGNPVLSTRLATEAIVCFDASDVLFITASESDQDRDLNGDTDTSDVVPVYFRIDRAAQTMTQGESPIIIDGPIQVQVCPEYIRVVGNASENNLQNDFNQDGDTDDFAIVVSRIRRSNGEIRSFDYLHGSDDGTTFPVPIGEDSFVFQFMEDSAGPGVNLNGASGDTDTADRILMFGIVPCN